MIEKRRRRSPTYGGEERDSDGSREMYPHGERKLEEAVRTAHAVEEEEVKHGTVNSEQDERGGSTDTRISGEESHNKKGTEK